MCQVRMKCLSLQRIKACLALRARKARSVAWPNKPCRLSFHRGYMCENLLSALSDASRTCCKASSLIAPSGVKGQVPNAQCLVEAVKVVLEREQLGLLGAMKVCQTRHTAPASDCPGAAVQCEAGVVVPTESRIQWYECLGAPEAHRWFPVLGGSGT